MARWYVLDGHQPVPLGIDRFDEVEALLKDGDRRRVAQTKWHPGGVLVSTTFLCMDHNWSDQGPPLLFETMIFGGLLDGQQWRYATWDEAEQGHGVACALVRATLGLSAQEPACAD